jgi:hypothetical protein
VKASELPGGHDDEEQAVLGRLIWTTLVSIAAALALALPVFAKPAHRAPLAARCPDQPTTLAFERWGDDAQYAEVPGGAFESELTWSATGAAALVAQSDPFDIAGPGAWSVRLGAGDSITSPVLCLSRYHPHLRFVAQAAGSKSHLRIEVLYIDAKGKARAVPLQDQPGDRYAEWAPSPDVMLKKVLPTKVEDARDVQLRFSVPEDTGDWLVDDVYVDPAMRG